MTAYKRRKLVAMRLVVEAEDHPVFVDAVIADFQGGELQTELLKADGVVELPRGFLLGGDGQGYLEEVGVGFDAIERSGQQVPGDSLSAMNWGYLDTPDHAFVAGFDLGLAAETYVADQATFLIPGARYEATLGGWRILSATCAMVRARCSSGEEPKARGSPSRASRRRFQKASASSSCRTRICTWD
jgi:hypothetical protein